MKKVFSIIFIFSCFFFASNNWSAAHPTCQQTLTQDDSACRARYLHRVLGDTSSFTPWLVLKIVESQKERRVAVEGAALYMYLKGIYNYDFKTYYSKMFSLLMSDKPLVLNPKIKQHPFIELDTSVAARKLLKEKGVEAVLAEYYASEQRGYFLLYALDIFFEYNYLIRRRDISVGLAIEKFECK